MAISSMTSMFDNDFSNFLMNKTRLAQADQNIPENNFSQIELNNSVEEIKIEPLTHKINSVMLKSCGL